MKDELGRIKIKSIQQGFAEMIRTAEAGADPKVMKKLQDVNDLVRAAYFQGARHVITQVAIAGSPKDMAIAIGALAMESQYEHRKAKRKPSK